MFRCVPCFAVLFLAVCLFPVNVIGQAHFGAPASGKSAENPGLSQGSVTPMAATSASSSRIDGTRANGKRGKAHAAKPEFAGLLVLHTFTGYPNDGAAPFGAALIRDSAGNLYGTTSMGGDEPGPSGEGAGTVYKITPTGTESILRSFESPIEGGPNADGNMPEAGLFMDSSGNLWGTLFLGGVPTPECEGANCGGLFELTSDGQYTFDEFGPCSFTGENPLGGFIQDSLGNFYGTSTSSTCETGGGGNVFAFGPSGDRTLHTFGVGNGDGYKPAYENLLMDSAGNIYGTTEFGGTTGDPCPVNEGCGAVFKIDSSGNESVLYAFQGGTDGCAPYGGVAMDSSGNLYGTTYGCGANNVGMVWQLSPGGTETILYQFDGANTGETYAGVILDSAGENVYGASGTAIFEINIATQNVTLLHKFNCATEGCFPWSGLIMDSSGNLYGANNSGGSASGGTVWELLKTGSSTTAVTSSANPSQFGQSVTFTATITGQGSGGPAPTGTVTIYDGATALATLTLNNGTAQYTTSALAVGDHSITCVYSGDTTYSGSTSAPLTQVVNQANTSTGVTSSVNPSVYGQPVTFTASITPAYGGSATGTVTFYDGATQIGSGAVSNNSAAVIVSTLAFGVHFITAAYSGDTNFAGSTSSQLIQLVAQASTTVSLVSSQNPSLSGNPVTFTATITGQYGGSATGTVTFYDLSNAIGSAPVNSNSAGLTTSSLAVGTHTITAVYGGDANFTDGTSFPLIQTVRPKTHGRITAPQP